MTDRKRPITQYDRDVNDFDLKLFALAERALTNSQRSQIGPDAAKWARIEKLLRAARPDVRSMMHPEHVKGTT